MPLILLTVLVTIAAALTISAQYHGPKRLGYISKPLTLVLIISIAYLPKYPVSPIYKHLIIAGLICSLIGDVFLMLPADRFVLGLVSFLIAHIFYAAALFLEGNQSVWSWAAVPLVVYGGIMLVCLWRGLGKLKTPVIVYMLVLLLMAWIAISRYLITEQSGSSLAAIGAVLFVASDSILALDKFRSSFRLAQLLILSTYFVAQCLIALST